MTNAEINEAVARKLGWTHTDYGEMRVSAHCGMYADHEWKRGKEIQCAVPEYSTSIEAAWEIVNAGHLTGVHKGFDGYWYAEKSGFAWDFPAPDGADTAPRAICEAFLKLP